MIENEDDFSELLLDINKMAKYPIYGFYCNKRVYPDNYKNNPFSGENPFDYDNRLVKSLFDKISLTLPHAMILNDIHIPVVHYGIASFENKTTVLIGPFCHNVLDQTDTIEYAKMHRIPTPNNFHIARTQIASVVAALRVISKVCCDRRVEISLPSDILQSSAPLSEIQALNYKLYISENDRQRMPLAEEQVLFDFIRHGKVEELRTYLVNGMNYEEGIMSYNEKKQAEYSAVIGISFFSRVAMESGINISEAHDLTDIYLQRASTITEIKEYYKLLFEAALRYAQEVKNANDSLYMLNHVEKCKNYIGRNITHSISLSKIAEHVGLSSTYLSKLFSKEENMTIQDYILDEKIHAACNMLKYSDQPISAISEYLGFCTQSYFGKKFKIKTKMTPIEYRHKYQSN